MPTLYVITTSSTSHKNIVGLFEEASKKRDVIVKRVPVQEGAVFINIHDMQCGDMLYRASTKIAANRLFKMLATQTKVKTLFTDHRSVVSSGENVIQDTLLQAAIDLPIIKTVFTLTDDPEILNEYAAYLSGFPLIVKATNDSHGRGVRKITNASELYAIAKELHPQRTQFVMRSFVPHAKSARLIVLGDRVIDSIGYYSHEAEFRTNVGEFRCEQEKFSQEIEHYAVEAVRALGAEFGGVDILIDEETKKPYIAEVNTPCYFPRAQLLTKTDIAGEIIDYLLKKQ